MCNVREERFICFMASEGSFCCSVATRQKRPGRRAWWWESGHLLAPRKHRAKEGAAGETHLQPGAVTHARNPGNWGD